MWIVEANLFIVAKEDGYVCWIKADQRRKQSIGLKSIDVFGARRHLPDIRLGDMVTEQILRPSSRKVLL
jgi:hypothetical protein